MKNVFKILTTAIFLFVVCSCSTTEDNSKIVTPEVSGEDELSAYLDGIEGCNPDTFSGDWLDINYMHSAFETLIGLTGDYDSQSALELLTSGKWSEFATYRQFTRDRGFELDKCPVYSVDADYVGYNHHLFYFFPDGTCMADIISVFDNEQEYFNREVAKNSTYTWKYNAENRSFTITQYYKDQTAEREYRILGVAQKILLVEFDTIAWNRNSHKDEPAIERMLFVIKN